MRASPLLLTGLLVAPDGAPWHSDGCGHYRLGKGKKFASARVEAAVLGRIAEDLASESTIEHLRAAMEPWQAPMSSTAASWPAWSDRWRR